MKYLYFFLRPTLLFCSILLTVVVSSKAQIKVGNHPTQIQPFSIIELESDNQGLRLTQIQDTSNINTVINSAGATDVNNTNNPIVQDAEGLIVFQKKDSSVYIRTHGKWKKLLTKANFNNNFWTLGGNIPSDSSFSVLGTSNGIPLTMHAGNNGYIIIHSNGNVEIISDSTYLNGSVSIADSLNVRNETFKVADSIYVNTGLVVNDSLILHAIGEALPGDNKVLILGADGTVRKMGMSQFQSNGIGIQSINGISNLALHFKFGEDASKMGPWIDSSFAGDSILIFNIPEANINTSGLISDSTQAFGGAKTFVDSLEIGSVQEPKATLDIQGNINLKTKVVTTDYDMNTAENSSIRTLIVDVSGKNNTTTTITLPNINQLNGRIYTIKKIGNENENQINEVVKIDAGTNTFADGNSSTKIYNNWTSLSIQALNNKWFIVGH